MDFKAAVAPCCCIFSALAVFQRGGGALEELLSSMGNRAAEAPTVHSASLTFLRYVICVV